MPARTCAIVKCSEPLPFRSFSVHSRECACVTQSAGNGGSPDKNAAWAHANGGHEKRAASVARWEHDYPSERRRHPCRWDAVAWVALGAATVFLITHLQQPPHWQHVSQKAATWNQGDLAAAATSRTEACRRLNCSLTSPAHSDPGPAGYKEQLRAPCEALLVLQVPTTRCCLGTGSTSRQTQRCCPQTVATAAHGSFRGGRLVRSPAQTLPRVLAASHQRPAQPPSTARRRRRAIAPQRGTQRHRRPRSDSAAITAVSRACGCSRPSWIPMSRCGTRGTERWTRTAKHSPWCSTILLASAWSRTVQAPRRSSWLGRNSTWVFRPDACILLCALSAKYPRIPRCGSATRCPRRQLRSATAADASVSTCWHKRY